MSSNSRDARFRTRLAKGTLPIAIVIGLRLALAFDPSPNIARAAVVYLFSAFTLWLGWKWMAATALTKWIGMFFAGILAIWLVLLAFGITLALLQLLLAPFLLALAFVLYDLFIRQPHKGRFARARAERRGLPL